MAITAKNAYALEWWINGCPDIDYDYDPYPTYKATLAQRLALMWAARGRCEICLHPDKGLYGQAGKLVLDHDHYDGTLRGMLCHRCNLILERTRTPAGLRQEAFCARAGVHADDPNGELEGKPGRNPLPDPDLYKAALLKRAAAYWERH